MAEIAMSSVLRRIADLLDRPDVTATSPRPQKTMAIAHNASVVQSLNLVMHALSEDHPEIANQVIQLHFRSRLMTSLTLDNLIMILTFLPLGDVSSVARTCKPIHRAVTLSEGLWKHLCSSVMPVWARRLNEFGQFGTSHSHEADSPRRSTWQEMIKTKISRDKMWVQPHNAARVVALTFPRGVHCVHFDTNEMMIGSGANNEVSIWSLKTGTRRQGMVGPGLYGHNQAVTCLQFNKDRVVTGSLDMSLRLWDRHNMVQLQQYTGHTDKVWCLCTEDHHNRLFSGSSDKTVRIWDIDKAEEVCQLREHKTSISSLRTLDTMLITGSAGNTIRVWSMHTASPVCIAKLKGHNKGVFCIRADERRILTGSLDNKIKIWDPRTFRLISTLEETKGEESEESGVISFAYDDTKVVSGGPDRILKLWDLRMERLITKMVGHTHWITSVQIDDNKIVSGSRDKSVRLWDITTGSSIPQFSELAGGDAHPH